MAHTLTHTHTHMLTLTLIHGHSHAHTFIHTCSHSRTSLTRFYLPRTKLNPMPCSGFRLSTTLRPAPWAERCLCWTSGCTDVTS